MKDEKPSVAIIVTCFNRWPYVHEAIDSVLAQSWPSTQCIVVDDASTDDSDRQLEAHYANEPRVTIHRLSQNRGQAAARNYGARICKTNFIGFLDSDDLLTPYSIETRMAIFSEIPEHRGLVFGDNVDAHSKQSLLPTKKTHGTELTLRDYISNKNWLNTNIFLIRRSDFLKLKGFNEELRKMEDIEFFLRALAKSPAVYASGPCCVVRDIAPQRARHDHKRIIAQGEAFIHAIEDNPFLIYALTEKEARKLIEASTRSILQSHYRMKDGKGFRKKLLTAVKNERIQLNVRLVKRYFLSFLHG